MCIKQKEYEQFDGAFGHGNCSWTMLSETSQKCAYKHKDSTNSASIKLHLLNSSSFVMARLSGLQREVLKLYRACMRSVKTKPLDTQDHWRSYVRAEFDKYRSLPKKSFSVIEHLLRVGARRHEMYLNPNIKDIH